MSLSKSQLFPSLSFLLLQFTHYLSSCMFCVAFTLISQPILFINPVLCTYIIHVCMYIVEFCHCYWVLLPCPLHLIPLFLLSHFLFHLHLYLVCTVMLVCIYSSLVTNSSAQLWISMIWFLVQCNCSLEATLRSKGISVTTNESWNETWLYPR